MMAKGKQDNNVDIDTQNEFQRYPLIFKKTRMNSCTNSKMTPAKSIFVIVYISR